MDRRQRQYKFRYDLLRLRAKRLVKDAQAYQNQVLLIQNQKIKDICENNHKYNIQMQLSVMLMTKVKYTEQSMTNYKPINQKTPMYLLVYVYQTRKN